MGQAKQRGALDQRRAEGEAKREKEQQRAHELLVQQRLAMTPAERARRHNALLLIAQAAGLAAIAGEK